MFADKHELNGFKAAAAPLLPIGGTCNKYLKSILFFPFVCFCQKPNRTRGGEKWTFRSAEEKKIASNLSNSQLKSYLLYLIHVTFMSSNEYRA